MRANDQVESELTHPSDEELRGTFTANATDALNPDGNLDEIRRHVLTCDICLLRREVLIQGGWSSGRPTSGHCPESSVWYAVAGGTATPAETQQLLTHASNCSSCAQALREAIEDMGTDFTAQENAEINLLATSRPEWPHEFARRLALEGPNTKPERKRSWFDWRAAIAAVASTAALALFGWQAYLSSALHVEHLLANAYGENRSFDLRLPDAPPADQKVALRGPDSELPPDLSDAYSIARRKAANHPGSAKWLDLKGRSELLAGNPDKATATLLAAEEQDPSNVDILNDLSVAYALRYDNEANPEDIATALRFSDKVLQTAPNDSVALFNRALLEARVPNIGNAAVAMSKFVDLYPGSPWAPEARRKLAKWQSMLHEHSAAPDDKPEGYLRAHGDSEAYLGTAVRQWLPRSAEQTVEAALQQLSAELVSQHGDVWLRDVLNQPMDRSAMESLGYAAGKNLSGDYSGAIRDAENAQVQLKQVGAQAAELWAEFELTYAEQRLLSGKRCGPHASQLVEKIQASGYPYLEGQALLEAAACGEFLENFAQSMRDVDQAIAVTERAKLRIVGLRALGFKASFESDQGNPFRMWKICQAGLGEYWGAWAPDIRAQHFLVEMEDWAEKEAQWPLAKSLQQEVLRTIEDDPDNDLKAMAHFRMARAAIASGDAATGDRELQEATRLFQTAPDPRTARLHAAESRVGLAAIQLRRGSPDDAAQSIESVDRVIQDMGQAPPYLQLEYQDVRGDIARAQKRSDVAEAAYAEGVRIAEQGMPTLPDAGARSRWSEQTEHAYRQLAAILLDRGDDDDAWQLWQRRCSAALAGSPPTLSLSSQAVLPANYLRLTYLVLDDRVAIWSSASGRRSFRPAELRGDNLEREARRLVYLCSRPDSDSTQLHLLARKLYQDSIPTAVEADLASASLIVVQPDSALADFPFEVLEDPSGKPLVESHRFVYSPAVDDRDAVSERLSAGAALFLVGNSHSTAAAQTGVEGEVRNLRRLYPGAVVLMGRDASREQLVKSLPLTELFEFVGHGRESFTGAGLMVREEDGQDPLVLDSDLLESISLSHMKLAALSACSTARGRHGLLDSQSLVLSFLRAGADTVIASRWDVDSATTAKLMTAFHQNLARGQTISEALWTASVDVRQSTGTHPFYWAAFSVYE